MHYETIDGLEYFFLTGNSQKGISIDNESYCFWEDGEIKFSLISTEDGITISSKINKCMAIIDTPTWCYDCKFCHKDGINSKCSLSNKSMNIIKFKKRPDWCELIPIQ